MQFHDHVRSAWSRLPLILAVGAVVVFLGIRGASTETRYTSDIPVLFSAGSEASTFDIVEYGSVQLRSLAEIATSPEVLQPVIDELGLSGSVQDLAEDVAASVADDTFLLTISAVADSRDDAERLAQAVASSLVASNEELTESGLLRAAPLTPQTTVTTLGTGASVQGVVKDLVVGLVVGLGLSILIDVLDPRVRNRSELALLTSVPVLGEVSAAPGAPYAAVASRLALKTADAGRRSILVLPAGSGESHVRAAARLGEVLAEVSASTLVITASQTEHASFTSRSFDATFPSSQPLALRGELESLGEQFDTIVIAAPGIDASPSPLLLARMADVCVLVVDERRDTRGTVLRAMAALRDASPATVCALLVSPRRLFGRRAQGAATPG